MKNVFEVEELGLVVDKVMIMPGSKLLLSGKPPSHWQRFGKAGVADVTVATPSAAKAGADDGGKSGDTSGAKASGDVGSKPAAQADAKKTDGNK